jgi:integrase
LGHIFEPVAEIAPAKVLEVVHAIEARAPESAPRVLQRIVNVFDFAVLLGPASLNPAVRLRKFVRDRNRGRQAALSADRLGEFLRALSVYRGDPETREAIRFLVLTLTRTSEVLGARWSEIDFERALWTVPVARMQHRRERRRDEEGNDLDHLVPLSRQALTLLRGIQPLTGRKEFIFPGRPQSDGSSRRLSQDTLRLGFRRMGFAEGEGTIHGLRATASTVLNGATKPDADGHPLRLSHPDWIEMALAHRVKDPVRGAYNRALYLDERRTMLQW